VRRIPPAGLHPSPSIAFLHECEQDGQQSAFPKAHTCSCCLLLPVKHASYDAFVQAFAFGIKNSHGFGYA